MTNNCGARAAPITPAVTGISKYVFSPLRTRKRVTLPWCTRRSKEATSRAFGSVSGLPFLVEHQRLDDVAVTCVEELFGFSVPDADALPQNVNLFQLAQRVHRFLLFLLPPCPRPAPDCASLRGNHGT